MRRKQALNPRLEVPQVDDIDARWVSGKRVRLDLQVAEPGSAIPDNSEWMKVCNGKMIYLQIIPDIGTSRKRWIKTLYKNIDTYYTSVEKELLNLFDNAINDAYDSPRNRNAIFSTAKSKMRSLFSAANSYVNFLYDKYESRLNSWMFVTDSVPVYPGDENIFADYQPKRTPDTVLDYMPALTEEIGKLPDADLKNLNELIKLLEEYNKRAEENPGHWEDGNVILGANPREYRPSKDELLASEIGNRISSVISSQPDIITEVLQKNNSTVNKLEYTEYFFTHSDVMGSGRFFYVQNSKKIIIDLNKEK